VSFAQVTAAVCREFGEPLEFAKLDMQEPGPTEAVVKVMSAGVCYTDIAIRAGSLPVELPMVLGHEGSGVVTSVGSAVTRVRPGDRVVLGWVPQCGACYFCRRGQPHLCEPGSEAVAVHGVTNGQTRLRSGNVDVRQLSGLGTFATALVAMEDALVPIPDDIPYEVAAKIGCAVLTGFGAAVNTAHIVRGDTVAVIGCGGVGLNTIQGAVLAGAERVIAIDANLAALDRARSVGATTVVEPGAAAGDTVLELTAGRGADVVFEVVGKPAVLNTGLAMTRRGGEFVVVGMHRHDATWAIAPMPHFIGAERRILGCRYGSCDLRRDVPRILGHYRRGELALDSQVCDSLPFSHVNSVFDGTDAAAGRPLLSFA
jgi:Zn-dependent alcohol dehydrogenase